MNNFLKNIKFIFMPRYWLMNHPYSRNHDKVLRSLLQGSIEKTQNDCTVLISGVPVWIANMPYSTGLFELSSKSRPSRQTIYQLEKRLKEVKMTHRDLEKEKQELHEAEILRAYQDILSK